MKAVSDEIRPCPTIVYSVDVLRKANRLFQPRSNIRVIDIRFQLLKVLKDKK